MKRIASLALVLVMIVAVFAGCTASATDQEKLVGTWKSEVDMTEAMKEEMGDELEGFELNDFKVTVIYKFTEEGTYTRELDKASAEQAMEGLMESFMKTMMEEMAKEAGMSLDDLLAASGMTMEDMMSMVTETLEGQDLVGEMVEEAKCEGKYKAENGKLFNTQNVNDEIAEDTYYDYTLDGDVLTITAAHGENEDDTFMLEGVYPVTLKKAA